MIKSGKEDEINKDESVSHICYKLNTFPEPEPDYLKMAEDDPDSSDDEPVYAPPTKNTKS